MISYFVLPSPVGDLLLVGDRRGLLRVQFQDGKHPYAIPSEWTRRRAPFADAIQQLREYFAGRRTEFSVPLHPEGTPFQQRVWKALGTIPYGQTRSYGEIARKIGKPTAARAVGAANGNNPLSIIVPCHRVIGSTGDLVGYGGGLTIKRTLLALESRHRS